MSNSMQALGWTLVHFCWQAAVIALLYRLLDTVFANTRSHTRYAFALAATMSMAIIAVATFGYEATRLMPSVSFTTGVGQPLQAATEHNSVSLAPTDTTGIIGYGNHSQLQLLQSTSFARVLPWVDLFWLTGVLALSLRMLGGWVLVRRLRLSAGTATSQEVHAMFSNLLDKLGIQSKVELLLHGKISGPLAMGIVRPIVLLPVSALAHLDPEQLEAVLAHELAHILRRDYLWNMIQTVVETLFFFHPAVWWLGGRTRQLRELCCDDIALSCCNDPVVFATALLRLEEHRSLYPNLAMALDGHDSRSSLKGRIIRILNDGAEGARRKQREVMPLALVGISALMGLSFLPLPHVSAGPVAQVRPQAPLAVTTMNRHSIAVEPTVAMPKQVAVQEEKPKADAVSHDVVETQEPANTAPVARPAPTPSPAPAVEPLPAPAAYPAPAPHVTPVVAVSPRGLEVRPVIVATIRPMLLSPGQIAQQSTSNSGKEDYISAMRAAGYDDLDKLITMKVQGVTPDYARSMAQLGYGKPTANELVSLKIFHVTPETVEKLRAAGLAPSKLHDLITYQIFKVTPEFVSSMKDAGFSPIPTDKLVTLRVHGITPEFARSIRQKYPDITLDQLVQMKIFRIDDEFIASAKSHGFESLSIDKLVRLRISGLLDDNSVKR